MTDKEKLIKEQNLPIAEEILSGNYIRVIISGVSCLIDVDDFISGLSITSAYAAETTSTTTGKLKLKLATEKVIETALDSADSLIIALPTPVSGLVNESILIFTTDTTLPTITQPASVNWLGTEPTIGTEETWVICYEQSYNGSSWVKYATAVKVA